MSRTVDQALRSGDVKEALTLIENGHTWVGSKKKIDLEVFNWSWPESSEDSALLMKLVLDLGLFDLNDDEHEPFVWYFSTRTKHNVECPLLSEMFEVNHTEHKAFDYRHNEDEGGPQIKVSKVNNQYRVILESYPDCEVVFSFESILTTDELLTLFKYAIENNRQDKNKFLIYTC